MVRAQAFVSKALFPPPAQIVKLGSCVSGFCEPPSGDSKICQLVGWGVCPPDEWKAVAGSSFPHSFDINMDAVYCAPHLSGENFGYTRPPRVSHGVFSAGPIAGTFAVPPAPPHSTVAHLRAQALAQAQLYGGAPTDVAHIPPPPARGRARSARAQSARRTPPSPASPPPAFVGDTLFFVRNIYFPGGDEPFPQPERPWCSRLVS